MTYTAANFLALTPSGGTPVTYFRPGCVHVTSRRIEKNQEVTTCESGRQVVTNMSDNEVELIELTFTNLQAADETAAGGTTAAGFNSLRTFVRDTAGFRESAIKYKPKGSLIGSAVDCYIDQSDLTDVEEMYGLYSCKLTLRRVIEP